MMTFEKSTGEAIARLMVEIRRELALEPWDYPGCLAAVGKIRSINPANAAMAALRLATTAEAHTPMALANREGQHWRERVVANTVRYPPKRGEDCRQHPGEWPESCRGCASERLAPVVELRGESGPSTAAHARAQLRLAASGLCSHGVTFDHCTQAHSSPLEAGTGTGGEDDPAPTEATSGDNRSADCPEGRSQARLQRHDEENS